MLDNFRTIQRNWDKATDVIREEIVLSSSDERGRKIEIQVTDNGQVVDLTGVGLNLYWETKDKHYNGLDNFDAVDIKKGVFELYPTTGMLSNVGELNAWLYLVTMDGEAITSVKLPIRIEGGINTEAVESQNSFSALTDALSRVVGIETDEILRQEQEEQRQLNEQARIDAENQRESDFDQAQQDRTDAYQTAESERDTQYGQAESQRDDWYELAEQVRDNEYAPRLQDLEDKTPGVHEWGIEGGSNEHGSWTKLPDGTMICRSSIDLTTIVNDYRVYRTWNFPQTFAGNPIMSITRPSNWRGGGANEANVDTMYDQLSSDSVRVWAYQSTVDAEIKPLSNVHVTAIGRWK